MGLFPIGHNLQGDKTKGWWGGGEFEEGDQNPQQTKGNKGMWKENYVTLQML